MHFRDRILFGLIILLGSGFFIWYGSPDRLGIDDPSPAIIFGFVGTFALGFILFSMGILGTEAAYPAFLSGLVLYFIIGCLLAVFSYVSGSNLVDYHLDDVGSRFFWIEFGRFAATWPLKLVQLGEILGWEHVVY